MFVPFLGTKGVGKKSLYENRNEVGRQEAINKTLKPNKNKRLQTFSLIQKKTRIHILNKII